jgi:hypothetical protein
VPLMDVRVGSLQRWMKPGAYLVKVRQATASAAAGAPGQAASEWKSK